jgi:hypothetical protein
MTTTTIASALRILPMFCVPRPYYVTAHPPFGTFRVYLSLLHYRLRCVVGRVQICCEELVLTFESGGWEDRGERRVHSHNLFRRCCPCQHPLWSSLRIANCMAPCSS